MDPLRRERIEELFVAARLLKGEERSAFLQQQCDGDEALFAEVLSLLAIDSKPGLLDDTETLTTAPIPEVVAGRFRIVRHIGKGGMGDVYEAADLRLKEHVALKKIRSDIASDSRAVERFKREIVLAKKVTHPNVCRIYDLGFERSGDGAETLFLTMELLDGETLSSRIKRGPIPETEAVPLIEDMADALSAAHKAGVVHRDFKSGNVMVVDGARRRRAVVTDFGLARALRGDEQAPLTRSGAAAGTVAYMAPEQIKGEEPAPTADIYALGIVMYEILTGRRPFTGDSAVSIAMKHVHEQPQPPRAFAPHLDPNWDRVILRCLRKVPEERFSSAEAVKAALVPGLTARAHVPALRRTAGLLPAGIAIAVVLIAISLVFSHDVANAWRHLYAPAGATHGSPVRRVLIADIENHTGEAVLDHTIGELLASTLEQSSVLKIFPAADLSEALQRMGKPHTAAIGTQLAIDICQREGLHAAIVGSVIRVGSEYVIVLTALDLHGEVITSVSQSAHSREQVIKSVEQASKTLRKSLGESANSITSTVPLEPVTSPSLQALEYYSLGKLQLYDGNAQDASYLFQRAIETDPSFAMAHCYAGNVYEHLGDIAAERKELSIAVSLSDRVAEPERLKILGDYSLANRDFSQAIRYYQLLSQLKPDNSAAHLNMGQAYLGEFNYARALAETDAAIRLGRAVGPEGNAAEILFLSGRTEEAIARADRVLSSHPEDTRALYLSGRCHLARGDIEAARGVFGRLSALGAEGQSIGHAALADMALDRGQIEEARSELRRAMVADEKAHNPYGIALRTLAVEAIDQKGRRQRTTVESRDIGGLQSDPRLLILAASLCHDDQRSKCLRSIVAALERQRASHDTALLQSFLAMAKSALALSDNKPKAAIDYAQLAVQFENSSFAVDRLASTYAAHGMHKEAISEFEKVLSRSNERMESYDGPAYHRLREIHLELAGLYRKIGDEKRASMHETQAVRY